MTTAQTTTSPATVAQKTAGKRGRPMIVPTLTDLQKANAVKCTVLFNQQTGKYDYDVDGGVITGSAKTADYLRNRIMGNELKNLAGVSNDFTRAFRIETIDADFNVSVTYVVKSK